MNHETTIQLPPIMREARIAADTVDDSAREFDVVWSTGARVARFDWARGETYLEELEVSAKAVRLSRLNGGAPFLDSHRSHGLAGVLGTVIDGTARVANGEGRARVRMATGDPDIDRIWNKIRQKIVRNISVGYVVHKFIETMESGKRVLRAVDWEPLEISAVPIGADAGAAIRSAAAGQGTACQLVRKISMNDDVGGAVAEERARTKEIMAACELAGADIRQAMVYVRSGKSVEEVIADLTRRHACGRVAPAEPSLRRRTQMKALAMGSDAPPPGKRGWLAARMAAQFPAAGEAKGAEPAPQGNPRHRGWLAERMAADTGGQDAAETSTRIADIQRQLAERKQ